MTEPTLLFTGHLPISLTTKDKRLGYRINADPILSALDMSITLSDTGRLDDLPDTAYANAQSLQFSGCRLRLSPITSSNRACSEVLHCVDSPRGMKMR